MRINEYVLECSASEIALQSWDEVLQRLYWDLANADAFEVHDNHPLLYMTWNHHVLQHPVEEEASHRCSLVKIFGEAHPPFHAHHDHRLKTLLGSPDAVNSSTIQERLKLSLVTLSILSESPLIVFKDCLIGFLVFPVAALQEPKSMSFSCHIKLWQRIKFLFSNVLVEFGPVFCFSIS